MVRLRLLKIVVQPVFVIDDGESLVEQTAQAVTVSAADWPAFPERFAADFAAMQGQARVRPAPAP